MVAGFQDDVDIEDQPHSKSLLSSDPVPSKNISLSSEEEAEGPAGHPGVAPQQCSEPETKWYGMGSPGCGLLRQWQPRVASELRHFFLCEGPPPRTHIHERRELPHEPYPHGQMVSPLAQGLTMAVPSHPLMALTDPRKGKTSKCRQKVILRVPLLPRCCPSSWMTLTLKVMNQTHRGKW